MINLSTVEHNIKKSDSQAPRSRRPDMSTFFAHMSQIAPSSSTDASEQNSAGEQHNNPHAVATPADMAAMFRLLQEQYTTLQRDSPTEANAALLSTLLSSLSSAVDHPPSEIAGVPQSYLDSLERVDKKELQRNDVKKDNDTCPICAERFLDDQYPLVVRLPCHSSHLFDLECVGPWLMAQGTCPLDRKEMLKKKEPSSRTGVDDKAPDAEEDEDDYDGMYA